MKKLKIIGISFLIASAIPFSMAIITYVNYQKWLEMIQEKCKDVPCMTPINNSLDYVMDFSLIGLVLVIIGITLLIINKKTA
jgi:hypothetical protein